jgi:peptidyl-prolyl cis-trans isomerase A (cyclophilin A)
MAHSIFDRLFRRSNQKKSPRSVSGFESLENRTLLSSTHVTVTAVTADNRGEVLMQLSGAVNPADVNTSAIQMYNAGPDNKIDTADDVQVAIQVHYNTTNNRITIVGTVPANEAYRVKLVASRILDSHNAPIDGDFGGAFPSGNGKAGGNFEFQVKNDTSATPSVRMLTTAGTITLSVLTKLSVTTKNFLRYANDGLYDGTIISRDGRTDVINGQLSIIQGGGFTGTDVGEDGFTPTDAIPSFAPIALQSGLSNTRGTIAMARGTDPNTATNQFFFNQADNTFLDPTGPGTGFSAFGTVSKASLAVIDAIYNANTISPNLTFDAVPQINNSDVVIQRVAELMVVRPL